MNKVFAQTIQTYKDAYTGHAKEVWALAILTLINRMGTMVLPFLTVYLNTILGYSLKDAGLLLSAFGLGSFGGSYIGGKLSDKWGPNRVIMYSMILSGLMLICLQFVSSFTGLFILIFLTALFGEAYRPALSTSIGMHVPKAETGRAMALIRLAINLGFSGAPAIGGFIAASLGYHLLFWIDGLTCISAGLYFAYVSTRWKSSSVLKPSEKKHLSAAEEIVPPYKNRNFIFFLIATFAMGFGFIQWFHSIPVFIKSVWGFDERYIGSLFALNGLLIVIIEMPAIHAIEQAKKIKYAVIAGLFLISASYLPFVLSAALLFYVIAVLLFTFGEIFYLPFNNSIALNMSPESKRGEYMSWYWMCWSLVHIIGPSMGLLFADQFGFTSFWIFISGLTALALLINWKLADQLIQQ